MTKEATREERLVEYKPFMSESTITLSAAIVQKLLCQRTKSGKVCDGNEAVKFMLMCRARELNPFEGDVFMLGFDTQDGPQFTIVTAHQAFLKRAETHPEYDGMESGVIVKTEGGKVCDRVGDFTFDDDALLGGWATVFFKNRKHAMCKRLKLETFDQNRARWNIDPAGMICKCAEGDALRSSFPTLLGGMYLADEILPPDARKNGRRVSRSDLNDQLRDTESTFVHPEPPDTEPERPESLSELATRLGCPDDKLKDVIELASVQDDPKAWIRKKHWEENQSSEATKKTQMEMSG